MNSNEVDYDEMDLADEVFAAIEKDYGRTIQRVAKFGRSRQRNSFDMTVVFSDFRILDCTIKLVEEYGEVIILVDGIYH